MEAEKSVDSTSCAKTECGSQGERAEGIVRKHVYGAAGAGLIPVPLIDLAALLAIQVSMLQKLASVYNVPFKQEIAKSAIGTLTASIAPLALAGPFASLLKIIPLIGTTTSAISMSITGGAATYALGRVFIQHFASGGTFLDFNPAAVREYFAEQFKEGKSVAQAARKSATN